MTIDKHGYARYTTAMTTEAAMTYLRRLRQLHGLSQDDIAQAAGVKSKQVYRWEKCECEPSGPALFLFTDAVHGSLEQVRKLLASRSMTAEDGQRLAEEWFELTDDQRSQIDAVIERTPPDELRDVVSELQRKVDEQRARAVRSDGLIRALRALIRGWTSDA